MCINLRLATYGGLYAREFEKGGRKLKVRVEGQLVFNKVGMITRAAVGVRPRLRAGDSSGREIANGSLVRLLAEWCPPFSGLPSLLPEPATTHAGLRPTDWCAAIPPRSRTVAARLARLGR